MPGGPASNWGGLEAVGAGLSSSLRVTLGVPKPPEPWQGRTEVTARSQNADGKHGRYGLGTEVTARSQNLVSIYIGYLH